MDGDKKHDTRSGKEKMLISYTYTYALYRVAHKTVYIGNFQDCSDYTHYIFTLCRYPDDILAERCFIGHPVVIEARKANLFRSFELYIYILDIKLARCE